ncbi:hypothetical protein [Cytobacillus oceanisediminis]|uniref:HNH endonuclease n=1 Tax=Cytobacillus oceanisediminis TaxID=665099 RepID=A0ABX3CYU0_9BACI|nr:hypothetical protein [Cytobacillus oceanisediminis]OHX50685.1 hypothetical protein BBV17_06595 [Cytobacillus oceanisediminis]
MLIVLSQKIVTESNYKKDVPFEMYHYPKKYRNQISSGDIFLYYQGDRQRKDNRYYFGCGLVGEITVSQDGENYYAKILNGIEFQNKVPIYNPNGGFYESIGYTEVRQKEKPAWQNSVRKISRPAFKTILEVAGLDYNILKNIYDREITDAVSNQSNFLKGLSNKIREQEVEYLLENENEDDIEGILLKIDGEGSIELRNTIQKVRKASRKTVDILKKLYHYKCQICGVSHIESYGVNVAEAHHIEYFTVSQNHQPKNIVILCPTHHRLIHAGEAIYDKERKVFKYKNGLEESLKLNNHL